MSDKQEGYGVCRNVEDAKHIAATAQRENLRGCYPSAAVVLAVALAERENEKQAGSPPFDYVAEAKLTESPHFYGEIVPRAHFAVVLHNAIAALSALDRVKKALFYGRALPPIDISKYAVLYEDCGGMLQLISDHPDKDSIAQSIIHGIIGKATEAGELLELLRNTVIECRPFDAINAAEEIGDGFWYDAILADALGTTFDEIQRTNIEKLRHRFPDRFTEYDANNRDLTGERQILEKNA